MMGDYKFQPKGGVVPCDVCDCCEWWRVTMKELCPDCKPNVPEKNETKPCRSGNDDRPMQFQGSGRGGHWVSTGQQGRGRSTRRIWK